MRKTIAAGLLSRSGFRPLLARLLPWSGVVVLNYHRVGDGYASLFDRGLWSADADSFAQQIRFCKAQLDLISPADLPTVLGKRRGRYGMITFDDGYRDNYDVAFPILTAERVPATFFVATGFVDEPVVPWWDEIAWMVRSSPRDAIKLPDWLGSYSPLSFDKPDRERAVRTLLRAYKRMPGERTAAYLDAVAQATGSGRCDAEAGRRLWMNWDMLRAMHAAGMTIGGHTISHPILARESAQRQREEILGCGERLATEIGQPMRYFSYPVGGLSTFDNVTRSTLRDAGVRYAFSYYGGVRRFDGWDDYDVRRVPVEVDTSCESFRSIISVPTLFA